MKVKLLRFFALGIGSLILSPIAIIFTVFILMDKWFCWIVNNATTFLDDM